MKKIVLSFLVLFMSMDFVSAQYVRKLKEPEFFIPEGDKMHKQEILPQIKKQVISTPKTQHINKKDEKNKKNNKEKMFSEVPEYKKIYDGYFNNINDYMKNKKFSDNIELDKDLALMSNENIFEVNDDTSDKITTKEQYDFYMLAKKILEN